MFKKLIIAVVVAVCVYAAFGLFKNSFDFGDKLSNNFNNRMAEISEIK